MTRRRIAVVGGGLAGISAALEAADQGAEVVLLERRSKLGGLTWSFQRGGLWFDNGQHVFLRCCTAYREFLDRIGATDQVTLQSRLDIPVLAPGSAQVSISRSNLPPPLHLAGSLLRYRHLSLRERANLIRPVLAMRRLDPDDPTLDTINFGEWLSRHGQDRRSVDYLWDLIALPTLNISAADASLAMAVKVFRTALIDSTDGGDVGWANVPLQQLHGDAAGRSLETTGVEVLATSRVRSVEPDRAGGWKLIVDSSPREPSTSLHADAVIVATPPNVANEITPVGALPPFAGLGHSPIVNVHLVLDRQVTDLVMAACVSSPIQFVFDRTSSSGLADGQCLSISLSAADSYIGQRPDELVRTFRTALDDIFPSARHANLVDGTVSREHAATFRAVPGTGALRPAAKTGLPGLALAGAWCATGWPATMEGAVRSGREAAAVVLGGQGHGPDDLAAVDGVKPYEEVRN